MLVSVIVLFSIGVVDDTRYIPSTVGASHASGSVLCIASCPSKNIVVSSMRLLLLLITIAAGAGVFTL